MRTAVYDTAGKALNIPRSLRSMGTPVSLLNRSANVGRLSPPAYLAGTPVLPGGMSMSAQKGFRRRQSTARVISAEASYATIVPRQSFSRFQSPSRPSPQRVTPIIPAYELVQGALVRWSQHGSNSRPPPTIVMLHGILGNRRNMQSFARQLVEGFPSWQVVLVDLRCHGESAKLESTSNGVESAAADILGLLSSLKLFPEILIGHSFGGKVVMSMAEQFGRIGMQMPRPVQVWVLDALPGEVRAGGPNRADHPADLIASLARLQLPIASRAALQTHLTQIGFSLDIARWASTNLRPIDEFSRQLVWSFNLEGIAEMYLSYEVTNLWPFLANTPQGVRVDFVKAANSNFRWAGPEEDLIRAYGHAVHHLPAAGHWVHTDNPNGLFSILAANSPAFGGSGGFASQRGLQGALSR